MTQQSRAKIFLASARRFTETAFFRSAVTIEKDDSGQPFPGSSSLIALKEQALAAGRRITEIVNEEANIFLLPLVGTICVIDHHENEIFVEAGEAMLLPVGKNTSFQIANPHEKGLISFIQCWSKRAAAGPVDEAFVVPVDIKQNKNKLIEISNPHIKFMAGETQTVRYFIARSTGRADIVKECSAPNRSAFVFVIEGAYEVENRLMEAKDGLALWDLERIEMECLSADGIVLVMSYE